MSFLAKSLEGGFVDEEVEVHRRADRVRAAASRDRDTGGRGLPEDGDRGADVFPVEEEVRRPRSLGAAPLEAARGGEPPVEAHGGGPESR